MKDKAFFILLSVLCIMFAIPIGIACYEEYLVKTKEVVIDSCIVRGISYDGGKTLLVVELPDHELAIVDASIYRYRSQPNRPKVWTGNRIRCRWKHGDTGKLGYSSREKGDI